MGENRAEEPQSIWVARQKIYAAPAKPRMRVVDTTIEEEVFFEDSILTRFREALKNITKA